MHKAISREYGSAQAYHLMVSSGKFKHEHTPTCNPSKDGHALILVDANDDWGIFMANFVRKYKRNPLYSEYMVQPDEFVQLCGAQVSSML